MPRKPLNGNSPHAAYQTTRDIAAWQQTPADYLDQCQKRYGEIFQGGKLCPVALRMLFLIHKAAVVSAIESGDEVSFEVLKHYPDLIQTTAEYSGDEELSYDSNGRA